MISASARYKRLTEIETLLLRSDNELLQSLPDCSQEEIAAMTTEERAKLGEELNRLQACREAGKEVMDFVEKLCDKYWRRYNELQETYDRFCRRHGMENRLKRQLAGKEE